MRKGQKHTNESRRKIAVACCGYTPWNKGLSKATSLSVCSIGLSNSRLRRGKTYEEIYGTEEALRQRELRRQEPGRHIWTDKRRQNISESVKGKPKSASHKETLSKNWDKNHPATVIERMAHTSRTAYRKGWYTSRKNACDIYFASSYELKAYQTLEQDETVIRYGRVQFTLPYIYNGNARRYLPDIMVEYADGEKEIIEVKPKSLTTDPVNVAKRTALQRYCDENSLSCAVWTEKELI
jgi:hypothetical protein